TVESAAAGAGALGVAYLTVHASGGQEMLRAASRGAARGAERSGVPAPRILAVTALTSLKDGEVSALGFGGSAAEMAERLAAVAVGAGIGGLVCSAREAPALLARHPGVFLCTPGIRPAGAALGDQVRVETPAAAIAAGSNLLVVGRPLHGAPDPAAAAKALHDEGAGALGREQQEGPRVGRKRRQGTGRDHLRCTEPRSRPRREPAKHLSGHPSGGLPLRVERGSADGRLAGTPRPRRRVGPGGDHWHGKRRRVLSHRTEPLGAESLWRRG